MALVGGAAGLSGGLSATVESEVQIHCGTGVLQTQTQLDRFGGGKLDREVVTQVE